MAGPESKVAIQKYGVVPCATGLAFIGLGCAAAGSETGSTDVLTAMAILPAGFVLAAYDVRRRSSRLRLGVFSRGEVSVEAPQMPPRVLRWAELSVVEPSLLLTLNLLAAFVGSSWAGVQVLWAFATNSGPRGTDPWDVLLTLSIMGWLASCAGSLLVERTRWVKLRLPGYRGAVFFSYRALEGIGALEGLRDARRIDGIHPGLYLVEWLGKPPAAASERDEKHQ